MSQDGCEKYSFVASKKEVTCDSWLSTDVKQYTYAETNFPLPHIVTKNKHQFTWCNLAMIDVIITIKEHFPLSHHIH